MAHKLAPRTQVCVFLIGAMLFTLSTPSVLALESQVRSRIRRFSYQR
jgi:hypothetical protein